MLVSLAWKNLWRNKLRSAVIITAIAIGIIGGVISNGLMTGMADQRINSAIANEVSNIQIQNPRFLLNHEIQYTLPSKTNWVEALSKYPDVSILIGFVLYFFNFDFIIPFIFIFGIVLRLLAYINNWHLPKI
jgi:ABC-type lipoprotein release transport system permease subunit